MRFFLLAFLVTASLTTFAQGSRIDAALDKFIKSPVMQQINKFKLELENSAKQIKFSKDFTDLEKKSIAEGYNSCIKTYNEFIVQIKNDILDVAMLKFIAKYPERYGKIVKADMQDIKEKISYDFHSKVLDTKFGATKFGNPAFIPVIMEVIKIVRDVAVWIRDLKKISVEAADTYLVKPFSLKTWEEL